MQRFIKPELIPALEWHQKDIFDPVLFSFTAALKPEVCAERLHNWSKSFFSLPKEMYRQNVFSLDGMQSFGFSFVEHRWWLPPIVVSGRVRGENAASACITATVSVQYGVYLLIWNVLAVMVTILGIVLVSLGHVAGLLLMLVLLAGVVWTFLFVQQRRDRLIYHIHAVLNPT